MKEEFVPPNTQEFHVGWEKWIDPFDNEEIEDVKKVITDSFNPSHQEETGFDEHAQEQVPQFYQNIRTMFTPFGLLPIVNSSLVSNNFKFWVGHCNFKLYEVYLPILKEIDGVESVEVLTPYRFRISIGKMFKDSDVMNKITQAMTKLAKKIKDEARN